jgi:Protein of unknown function (DUF1553)/Protein of unknown function (DUF1549)/Planctomycete cytochrome C
MFPDRVVQSAFRWIPVMATVSAVSALAADLTFNQDIRPILSDNCFSCHGLDAKKRKAGLRLDTADGAFTPNKEGRVAIRPGDLKSSELWKRLETQDPDSIMPPPESHKTITAAQKKILRQWIEQGAPYQKHWAFEAPRKVQPPSASNKESGPIDAFLADRWKKEGVSAGPEADRSTLLRRLSMDLRGLPPTPAEVDAFLADSLPGAYERCVDRLMDSPQYGEQMGRHWLDVARYADTHGLHLDNERQIWPYRDWVVRAFNRNLPFDQFTVDQLAGDLLPSPSQDQLIATGFNRNNVTTGEGGAIDAEFVFRYAVERTSTTAQAWMGLTAGCAVCHDHKFDPISQKEFYSLYAFFHSAADPPVAPVKSEKDIWKLTEFDSRILEAEKGVATRVQSLSYTDPATLNPPPPAHDVETVWLEDGTPTGARVQGSPTWVKSSDGPVKFGQSSLQQRSDGMIQSVYEGLSFAVPASAKVFAWIRLDPASLPKMVMLQFFQGDWEHRVVWGDVGATDWGTQGKPSRMHAGPLPKAGEWVRLEFDAEALGLKAGQPVSGIAYTQHGGLVHWDHAGIMGRVDPARDPLTSLSVWIAQNQGKEPKELPENLRKIFKDVPADQRTPEQTRMLREYYLNKVCTETRATMDPLNTAVIDLRQQRDKFQDQIPQTFIWRDMDKPRDSFVMVRGQYDAPGEKVSRAVPAVFPVMKPAGQVPNRLDLARWLVSSEHPLTARVTVNRLWQQFFGVGLVKTADDFGSQGEPPSHPELLDWLAVSFQESGWDVKALVRTLVTSAAYRQSAAVPPALLQRDPENRWLARGPRFRLDAEQLRDNALFVSGLLDGTLGGKGVRPYQPPNIWEPVAYSGSNTRNYRQDSGSALYRRSLYVFFKRTAPPPFMATFDAPNREQFCSRRERSNTPLQALQLLNDVQHFEAARGLASRMMTEGGARPEDRIRFAFKTVLSRPPSATELEVVGSTFGRFLERYQADPESARKAIHVGESAPRSGLPETELAAYTLTANLLLNLDETVTRN